PSPSEAFFKGAAQAVRQIYDGATNVVKSIKQDGLAVTIARPLWKLMEDWNAPWWEKIQFDPNDTIADVIRKALLHEVSKFEFLSPVNVATLKKMMQSGQWQLAFEMLGEAAVPLLATESLGLGLKLLGKAAGSLRLGAKGLSRAERLAIAEARQLEGRGGWTG